MPPCTLSASMHAALRLMLPLQALTLLDTHVPPSALHALTGLQQLETLTLDLKHCAHLTTDGLAATLCLLCRGVRTLREVTVMTKSELLDADACVDAVVEQLEAWEVAAPRIEIYPEAQDGEDEEEERVGGMIAGDLHAVREGVAVGSSREESGWAVATCAYGAS